LGKALGVIDMESAAQVAGARFAYLKGDLVLLQQGLITYVLSVLTNEKTLQAIAQEAGLEVSSKPFIPVLPPVFIRPEILEKMDRLEPKEDRYYVADDDLYLVGSAEHTLGPLHMNETLAEEKLPLRYIGYATSFRREAGSYGKDTKGIIRVHQFDKLEMESFTTPETALAEQNFFVALQEHLLRALELPYQVVQVCTGDMGKPNVRQIDMETWFPHQEKYRETHSADYMGDYQARRLAVKVRRGNGQTEFVHMNDATAFALGRILAAVLENYQESDGSVRVPRVLQGAVGKQKLGTVA
jgi:seryl-tRNA synthetase